MTNELDRLLTISDLYPGASLRRSWYGRRLVWPTAQSVAGHTRAVGGIGVTVSVSWRKADQAIQAPLMAMRTAPIGWVGRLAPVVAMPSAAPRT